MGIKEKFQEKTDPLTSKFGYLKTDAEDIKKILETKDVIYQKTDAIAILVKKKGELKKFLEVFDSITKEGYELKAKESVTDPIPKLNVNLAYLYIFQNKKYIQ
jgi:hypothetical protein